MSCKNLNNSNNINKFILFKKCIKQKFTKINKKEKQKRNIIQIHKSQLFQRFPRLNPWKI